MATRLSKVLLCALLLSSAAHAQLYTRFGPANGILKGSTLTPQTSSAAWADVQALLTGTCDASHVVSGAGTCITPAAGTITGITWTVPAGLSISGSPCTSGACSFTLSTALSGIVKGTGTGFGVAAASDVTGLFTGTCNSTTYLRGDGSCNTPPSGGSPGGALTDLQFFDTGGVFGGASNVTYNSTSGDLTIAAPTSGVGLTINSLAGHNGLAILGASTSGQSYGLNIVAGTTTADYPLNIVNQANTLEYFEVAGDGSTIIGAPTGGGKGIGSINASSVYTNGTQLKPVYMLSISGSVSSCTATGDVTSCTRTGTGTYTFNLPTSVNYCVVSVGGALTVGATPPSMSIAGTPGTGPFTLRTFAMTSNTNSDLVAADLSTTTEDIICK